MSHSLTVLQMISPKQLSTWLEAKGLTCQGKCDLWVGDDRESSTLQGDIWHRCLHCST